MSGPPSLQNLLDPRDPWKLWTAIIGAIVVGVMNMLHTEEKTSDRFTGAEGDLLRRQIEQVDENMHDMAQLIAAFSQGGPTEVRTTLERNQDLLRTAMREQREIKQLLIENNALAQRCYEQWGEH